MIGQFSRITIQGRRVSANAPRLLPLARFQSIAIKNEPLGNVVVTIDHPTDGPRSAPFPLARRVECGDG